jgi:hypothetical protein
LHAPVHPPAPHHASGGLSAETKSFTINQKSLIEQSLYAFEFYQSV